MASEDQLSGNTFVFAHVARAPSHSLPDFMAQSRRSSGSPCWGMQSPDHVHGHHAPPNHTKSSCNVSRSSLSWFRVKAQKPGYLAHPGQPRQGLIPSTSLRFPSNFFWIHVFPISLQASMTPWPTLSTFCSSHSFTFCSGA